MQENKKLAIIPTGEYQRGNITSLAKDFIEQYNLNLYVPEQNGLLINSNNDINIIENVQKINWGFASTNSPELRAKMLYNAIFKEKIDYIYITGGRGNEYTIIELNKLIEQNKENKLNEHKTIVYGMSDATNMINYLGQRNIAKTFISMDIFPPMEHKNPFQTVKINMVNNNTIRSENLGNKDEIKGVLIPEYSLRSYKTLQEMRIFNDKINFLATEIHFKNEAILMEDFYKNIDSKDKKNIIFCLSAISDQNSTSNQIKKEEQDKFKKSCLENGFSVIEGIKFGHNNNMDQYLSIPSYCECTLNLNESKLKYSHNICKMNNDNSKAINIIQYNNDDKYNSLEFNKNYIHGGYSEVSTFIDKNQNYTTIFTKASSIQQNIKGEFKIEFDTSKNYKTPFVYIQNLERLLKDIDKLDMKNLQTLRIINFDLPLKNKLQIKNGNNIIFLNKTNEEVLNDIICYISKNYKNLKDVEINLGNGLSFKNGKQIKSWKNTISNKTFKDKSIDL